MKRLLTGLCLMAMDISAFANSQPQAQTKRIMPPAPRGVQQMAVCISVDSPKGRVIVLPVPPSAASGKPYFVTVNQAVYPTFWINNSDKDNITRKVKLRCTVAMPAPGNPAVLMMPPQNAQFPPESR